MDKAANSLIIGQEPRAVDLDGVALLEDRLLADLGDPNGDSASMAKIMADTGTSYELFASVQTQAITNTLAYNLAMAISGTCTVAGNTNVAEAPEAAGTINTIKVGGFSVSIAAPGACTVDLSGTLSGGALHITDTNSQNNSAADSLLVCSDRDDDGVADPEAVTANALCGPADNCPDIPNPDQADTDHDGKGDVCDDTPSHDDGVKSCMKFGPAPINLSDTAGSYMWLICEIGNFSGHDDVVVINPQVTGNPANCTLVNTLVIPGRTRFILLEDEQKFVLLRSRFECHTPAVAGVYPITASLGVDHQLHTILPDGDDTNTANDLWSQTQNINVSAVTP
jgi:hypothetical protein